MSSIDDTTESDEETAKPDKKAGTLDLVGLFEAEALTLLSAVDRGRILHGTNNIRDSGSPLEAAFRVFLKAKLPSQFKAMQGYLFDVGAACTPQIDAMVVDTAECHELLTSSEGSAYVPFTSGLAVFEIKNSTYATLKSMTQLATTLTAINDMWSALRGQAAESRIDVLSVMLFARSDTCKPADFQKWFEANKDTPIRNQPKYIVLLDQGLIISRRSAIHAWVEFDKDMPLEFDEHANPGELYVFSPENTVDLRSGRTLLWLYFTLISFLNRSEAKPRRISAFTEAAVRTYAMLPRMPLAELASWKDLA